MFSARTDWDFRLSPLFALVQDKRARGETILDLTESNPTKCGFLYPERDPADTGASQRFGVYSPDPKGIPSARLAIAEWYERQNIAVDPDRVVLTSSTSEAYSFLLRLLCNVGDTIAVPRPSYPLFEYLARLNDVLCQEYRLAYDGEWHIDFSSLDDTFSSNAEALILVHPNNPTGSFVKKEERDRLVSAAQERKIPLIVDEVFEAFPFDQDPRRSGSFAGTTPTLTFTLNGLSKLAGLPQMKLAWIVVSGPDDECAKALQRLEVIADTYLSVSTPAQLMLPGVLKDRTVTDQILRRVKENYESLKRSVGAGISATLLQCEGGWSAIIRLPATHTDEEWGLELLQTGGVLAHPGHLFDFALKSCIVVSLLPEQKVFKEGVARILSSIE
jgi:alanine-synthesizing transaminase